MKKAAVFVVALLISASVGSAATVVYTSFSSWAQAIEDAGSAHMRIENFTGDTTNHPGLSILGTVNGTITDDRFEDTLDSQSFTMFSIDTGGIFGWGGAFDVATGGPGIAVYLWDPNGEECVDIVPIPAGTSGFWGVVTDTSHEFAYIELFAGNFVDTQAYALDDVVWNSDAATPEPATCATLSFSLLGLLYVVRRKRM